MDQGYRLLFTVMMTASFAALTGVCMLIEQRSYPYLGMGLVGALAGGGTWLILWLDGADDG